MQRTAARLPEVTAQVRGVNPRLSSSLRSSASASGRSLLSAPRRASRHSGLFSRIAQRRIS